MWAAKRDGENGFETITIKMPDKLKAIELDAKLAGELKAGEVPVNADNLLGELLALIRAGR